MVKAEQGKCMLLLQQAIRAQFEMEDYRHCWVCMSINADCTKACWPEQASRFACHALEHYLHAAEAAILIGHCMQHHVSS